MTDSNDNRAYRLSNIDMVRGLAIVLMVIDHVRDFFLVGNLQDPMGDPDVDPFLYLTRWITHFCAPVFVLLAGTSAGLMTTRKSSSALGQFLLKRGLWLLVVEVTLISTAMSFAPFGLEQLGGKTLIVLQVIYAIAVGMMVLALAQFLGRRAFLAAGLVIFFGHNLLDAFWPTTGILETQWPLWVSLQSQIGVILGPFMILFALPALAVGGRDAAGFRSCRCV